MPIKKLKRKLSSQLFRNISWLGTSELLNRIFRFGVTILIARILSPYDYGLVAIISIVNEFINVFSLRGGIGSKIVQANETDVKSLCDTAYWMNWILCISLLILQCFAAFPIAWFYGDNNLILPICILSLGFLIQPFFDVHGALVTRENRLKIIALCNTSHSILSSILTVGMALLGMGIWAVVLPNLLTAPVWIVILRKNHPWRSPKHFTLKRWYEIFSFGRNILGVELLNKLRANLDYLLVGHFLGVQALGIYYFAFNAGLGISLSMISIICMALFPHLCAARNNLEQFKKRYFSSLKMIALIFVPLVLLQSILAPFYVPIVFGQKWVTAIPILILICLSALPRPFALTASQVLQAIDKTHIDLYWNLIFTVIFAVFLLVAVKEGIFWVAAAVLICHALVLPIFTILIIKYVFIQNPQLFFSSEKL
ncbi:MAG: lipopolysaccharide biosynthesis protein [Chroococcidiopsidaceae cyanobacterium CP_BM_ER_R8_30]|nr:lipopolysaccharide biosynthesis protein [Chroococcidiopsidaceae cyanobacterium CP_BM_ER_R8_30]